MKSQALSNAPFHWRDLIGFDEDLTKAARLFQQERLPQALLFVGRDGIGKRSFVLKLLAYIYCVNEEACGNCGSCRELAALEHDELLWLDTEKSFKLEHAQKVQEHLTLQSSRLQRGDGSQRVIPRVVVMPDVERLNVQGANRLLKTLEEPVEDALIIFTSSQPKKLLDTVLSRVVQWQLQPPLLKASLALLQTRFPEQSANRCQKVLVSSGMSLSKAIERLQGGAIEEEESLDHLVKELLFSRSVQVALDASKSLVKERQISANDLAHRIELLLNQYYRWRLSSQPVAESRYFERGGIQLEADVLRRWRDSLATIRLRSEKQGIPLNVQLLAESFALTR